MEWAEGHLAEKRLFVEGCRVQATAVLAKVEGEYEELTAENFGLLISGQGGDVGERKLQVMVEHKATVATARRKKVLQGALAKTAAADELEFQLHTLLKGEWSQLISVKSLVQANCLYCGDVITCTKTRPREFPDAVYTHLHSHAVVLSVKKSFRDEVEDVASRNAAPEPAPLQGLKTWVEANAIEPTDTDKDCFKSSLARLFDVLNPIKANKVNGYKLQEDFASYPVFLKPLEQRGRVLDAENKARNKLVSSVTSQALKDAKGRVLEAEREKQLAAVQELAQQHAAKLQAQKDDEKKEKEEKKKEKEKEKEEKKKKEENKRKRGEEKKENAASKKAKKAPKKR